MNGSASAVSIGPGEFHFGVGRTRIHTLLGSCVAVTLWHPRLKIGGMCHYMLPKRPDVAPGRCLRQGAYADDVMQLFCNELQRTDTRPQDYVAKLFGGGCMIRDDCVPEIARSGSGVADWNIQAGRQLLKAHGFKIAAEECGGYGSRVVAFDLWSGDVWVRRGAPMVASQAQTA